MKTFDWILAVFLILTLIICFIWAIVIRARDIRDQNEKIYEDKLRK